MYYTPHMQVRSDTVKSMIVSSTAAANRPPRSPPNTSSPRTHIQTGNVSKTTSIPSSQQGAAHEAKSASPKGPGKSGTVAQHQVPGAFGQQDGASNGSCEFSELENKEASKRPNPKKGGPVLRRVQSESSCQHFLSLLLDGLLLYMCSMTCMGCVPATHQSSGQHKMHCCRKQFWQ